MALDNGKVLLMPLISKMYCSSSEELFVVRRRPTVVSGGGFVVTDCSQKVIFKVDGCGVLGTKGELVLRDGNGDALLIIRRKGGFIEALSIQKKWRGYTFDFEGFEKLVFTLKEPIPISNSCLATNNNPIRISTESPSTSSNNNIHDSNYFKIKGKFPERECTIVDSRSNIVAQVGVKEEVSELMKTSKDLYHVVVKQGIDKAFIFGIIAVLDYIYGESTRC
ncbi:hypothetical protein ACFE04_019050 [Oxalis oulophora]